MAKKGKLKLPKRIAGVKVPKPLRKGPIAAFINSSTGQLLIAECLMLASGLVTARKVEGTEAGEAMHHPIETLREAGKRVAAGSTLRPERVTAAFTAAAAAFRAALADDSTHASDDTHEEIAPAAQEVATDEERGSKKKPASSRRAH